MLRCPQCRTRRATYESMQKHINDSGHKYCGCGGYHYKHRLGSPCCDGNPFSGFYRALRCVDITDDELQDIAVDIIWDTPQTSFKKSDVCPF